jgi:hypothetical protein
MKQKIKIVNLFIVFSFFIFALLPFSVLAQSTNFCMNNSDCASGYCDTTNEICATNPNTGSSITTAPAQTGSNGSPSSNPGSNGSPPVQNLNAGNSGSPTFSISPSQTSYQIGNTVNIAFVGMPSAGWRLNIKINNGGAIGCFGSSSASYCTVTLSQTNNAVVGSNLISVTDAFDSQQNPITFQNAPISITIANTANTQPTLGGSTITTNPSTSNSSATLYNPLPENDLTHVFLLVTKSFLDIMGIWAVMFIIFGGFQMVMSSGNEEAYLKAKKTITWAVLGLAVAILSFSIVAIVEDLLQANIQAPTTTSQSTPPTTQ